MALRRRLVFFVVVPLVILLAVFLLLSFVFRDRLLTAAGQALIENNGPQKADCILVLGGDNFGTRTIKAAQLAQAGYAPYVLVDGPPSLIGHESDVSIQYAVEHGFPRSLFRPIWLPAGVDSTSTEVEYVANNILRPAHVRKVLMVTSNFHTRRAARFMRTEVPWLTTVVVAAPDPFFTANGWWKTRNGKKTFLLEWTKSIAEWWGA